MPGAEGELPLNAGAGGEADGATTATGGDPIAPTPEDIEAEAQADGGGIDAAVLEMLGMGGGAPVDGVAT